MGAASAYLSAVVAGAVTAGIGAVNLVAVPEADDSAKGADADLAAVTIPIVDLNPTIGPLTFSRILELTLGAEANKIFGTLYSEAASSWQFPLLSTGFSNASSGKQTLSATRNPGESLDFGFTSSGPETSSWGLLGLAGGSADLQQGRALGFSVLTGGSEGIGAGLGGTLADASAKRSVSVLGSGFTTDFDRTVGDFGGQLSAMPFDGFKAVGDGTLAALGGNGGVKLGSLQLGGGGKGGLGGKAGLCVGSAQGTGSCAGQTAFASVNAPIEGGFGAGGSSSNIVSADIPTNVAVAVADRRLSVTGDIGGTVSIGSVQLGRVIPIDIQIPRAANATLAVGTGQSPRKLFSGNEVSSAGRHARDAVNGAVSEVKSTVKGALDSKPRHAKPDNEN